MPRNHHLQILSVEGFTGQPVVALNSACCSAVTVVGSGGACIVSIIVASWRFARPSVDAIQRPNNRIAGVVALCGKLAERDLGQGALGDLVREPLVLRSGRSSHQMPAARTPARSSVKPSRWLQGCSSLLLLVEWLFRMASACHCVRDGLCGTSPGTHEDQPHTASCRVGCIPVRAVPYQDSETTLGQISSDYSLQTTSHFLLTR